MTRRPSDPEIPAPGATAAPGGSGKRRPGGDRLSIRATARRVGLDESTLREAIKTGRVSRPASDGLLNLNRVERELESRTDPTRSHRNGSVNGTTSARERILSAQATIAELEASAAVRRSDSLQRPAIHKLAENLVQGAAAESFDAAVAHLGDLFPEFDPGRLVALARRVQQSVETRMLPWARQHVDDLLELETTGRVDPFRATVDEEGTGS